MTQPLSVAERKHRLPYGKAKEIAQELGCSPAYVSMVLSAAVAPRTEKGRRNQRRVAVRIARVLGVPLAVAFPELASRGEPAQNAVAVA